MVLQKNERKYKHLSIIGNGFDLAHGYKTTYRDFVNNTKNSILEEFKQLCSQENIATWYDFENNINLISINLYHKNFIDGVNFDEISNKITKFNDMFIEIHNLLLKYLDRETTRFSVKKIKNVNKILKKKTKVINFNYTKIAEIYNNDIFYVHGSIDENNIILGYDYRDEPCLISMEYMYWFKKYRRELIAFKRYLQNEEHLEPTSLNYRSLIENFEKYQLYANSGRGIDEEVETEIIGFSKIEDFICNKCEYRLIPDIDYTKIKTISIMGHGIESDKEFLNDIMEKCINLKKVIIFKYNGETDESFNRKLQFFKPYCKKIYSKYY